MPKIQAEQLTRTLESGLMPIYLVSGDETLLVQEACDAIRAAARANGFEERELYHTDAGFQWPQLLQSANSLCLFASRKIIEVRAHNGKPGDPGKKALLEYCESPSEDNLLLLVTPKLDRSAQNSAWYKAIDKIGGTIALWPITEKQLPRWIDRRLKSHGLKADSQAIDILASRCEGNLLAAVQEIEKLKLLADGDMIDGHLMSTAVVDSARYDIFNLVDKAISGDSRGAVKNLHGLKAEGTEAPVVLWALAREVRALNALKFAQSQRRPLNTEARKHGIFDKRLPLIQSALNRISPATLRLLLRECALADRGIKGMSQHKAWEILLDIVLTLSGANPLTPQSQAAALKS